MFWGIWSFSWYNVLFSVLFLTKGKMRQRYPMYSSTALMCFCGAIQAGIYAFIRERDSSAWNLGWNIRLFTPAYSVCPSILFSFFLHNQKIPSGQCVQIRDIRLTTHHVLHPTNIPNPWALVCWYVLVSIISGHCMFLISLKLFQGIASSGLGVTIIAWCTKLKGPLYVSSFYPLSLVFVAIVGTIVLPEELHLGRLESTPWIFNCN